MSQKSRVSIVDDDPSFLIMVDTLVMRLGHEPVCYPAPISANDMPAILDADLILADLMMPGFDGIELLRAAKSADIAPPVIVMTGYTDLMHGFYSRAGVLLGASQVISKADLAQLLPEILDRMLQAAKAAD